MRRLALLLPAALLLAACDGPQSAMTSLGVESERVTLLSWVLFIGGGAIMGLMLALTGIALWGRGRMRALLVEDRTILLGGLAFPLVTLTILLIYGFSVLGAGASLRDADDKLRIEVVGEQWWWRVTYLDADGTRIVSANELRIPTGRTIELTLTTADVLHSFWLPAYAGKLDMIPGRANTMHLVANEPGVVRGQCAEYCGGAHALMAFYAVALEPGEFEEWLAAERGPAVASRQSDGQELFMATGCGGCHAVRGTAAEGTIGPDLTHVAGRHSLGAGIMPNDRDALHAWIGAHQQIKPENRMPSYDFLTEAEIDSIAGWLAELQ